MKLPKKHRHRKVKNWNSNIHTKKLELPIHIMLLTHTKDIEQIHTQISMHIHTCTQRESLVIYFLKWKMRKFTLMKCRCNALDAQTPRNGCWNKSATLQVHKFKEITTPKKSKMQRGNVNACCKMPKCKEKTQWSASVMLKMPNSN